MPSEQTGAAKQARDYLKLYPATPAKVLALKFGVDPSTIYRSAWWQENKVQQAAKQTQR